MIDRGDIRQAIQAVALSGLHCRARCGQFEHKADSLIAKFKGLGGTVREIDVWQSLLVYLRSGYHHHNCLPVENINHYRDNAITYKAQRDKNARTEAGERDSDMQMRQRDVALLDAKYTKELADAKAENRCSA